MQQQRTYWPALVLLQGLLYLASMPGLTLAIVPGDVIDMSNFKAQLPIDAPNSPDELVVKQPALATFANQDWFYARNSNGANVVVFKVAAGGAHSQGSQFARCELAETVYSGFGGGKAAAWSIAGPVVHTMTFTGSVVSLPPVRPTTVIAQIKGAPETPMQIRVQGSTTPGRPVVIKAAFYNQNIQVLDANYVLGAKYTVRISAGKNAILVYYNDMTKPKYTLKNTAETKLTAVGWKVGNYLQSSPEYGESPTASASVYLYALKLTQA